MEKLKFFSFLIASAMAFSNVGLCSASAKSRVSVHDPSIMKDERTGTYYVFGSHIEVAKSSDLQNWRTFANGYATTGNVLFGNLSQNLGKAFAWSGENLEDCANGFAVWAPDVVYNPSFKNTDGSKGAYLMYFCTSSTYKRSVIAFASSKNVEGPYTFVDTLIYSGFTENDSFATSSTKYVNRKYTSTNVDELISAGQVSYNSAWFNKSDFNSSLYPNAIDPTIYYDTDGKMYMCYGSWSGGIFTLEIDPQTGKCIHPKTGTTIDGRMVDSYFGTKISGGFGKSGEGPFIEYNSDTGYYYLWVTYGGLTATGGYNMRVFRSKDPAGPFIDPAGKPAVLTSSSSLDQIGQKVMGNYKFTSLSTAYMAGGHNSVLKDDDGNWYLVYHTRFNKGTEYHEVRVHSMFFNENGWPVTAPYEYSDDCIAEYGYNTSDITGNYEFINHGNDTSKVIHESVPITLNTDGTITGSVSGTWKQNAYSAETELTIDKTKYYGYFVAAQDEDGKKVMSFTASGANNLSVWGVKTDVFTGFERNQTGGPTAGWYTVANLNSKKYLTYDGSNAIQSSTQTKWELVHHNDNIYSLLNTEGLALTVENDNNINGNNVYLSAYSELNSQKFKMINNTDGTVAFLSCSSSFTGSLDVYEISKDDGANICQWEYWCGDGQKFILTPTEPEKVKGDINCDNSFNVQDVIMLSEYCLCGKSLTNNDNADINEDDVINIIDYILIKELLILK